MRSDHGEEIAEADQPLLKDAAARLRDSCLGRFSEGQSRLLTMTHDTVGEVIVFFQSDEFWTLKLIAQCVESVAAAWPYLDDSLVYFILDYFVAPRDRQVA
jgi:phosphate starvation-inducible membrane PsiE